MRANDVTRFDLDGMVALVTGGSGMIGRAVAQRMAAGGARLALADLGVPETVGGDSRGYAADLADAGHVRTLFDAVLADYG